MVIYSPSVKIHCGEESPSKKSGKGKGKGKAKVEEDEEKVDPATGQSWGERFLYADEWGQEDVEHAMYLMTVHSDRDEFTEAIIEAFPELISVKMAEFLWDLCHSI